MKHRAEILISISIVVVAIVLSIANNDHGTIDKPHLPATVPPPDEKKQRCMESTALANRTIEESLALVNSLDPDDVNERQALKQHIEKINVAKKNLEECRALVRGYEGKIEALENRIKTLQKEAGTEAPAF